MSFQAMTWAVTQRCDSSGEKLVLIMLANHTNSHTGQCNPSHKLLADECSMGVSTLKRHLQSLTDKGLISVIPSYQDGVNLPNRYLLKLEGVGPNRAGGRSKLDGGVGSNRATNQEEEPVKEPSNRFDEFWEVWPKHKRKINKFNCMKRWKQLKLDEEADQIIAHVEASKDSDSWVEGFIPLPMTYINGRRWMDEVIEKQKDEDFKWT
jgi:DNA-binding transcriptional MocR family regulator